MSTFGQVNIIKFYIQYINKEQPEIEMMMKHDVLSYENNIIRRESETEPSLDKHDPHSYRYGEWQLFQTIQKFINKPNSSIKWIGNDSHSNILAFFYAILSGCLKQNHRSEDTFLQLKHCLYQEIKETLSKGQQKVFVEHLGLIQYSKNIGEFLKKSSHLESILMKIFLIKRKQMAKKNFKPDFQNKIFELQWYATIFPFLSFQAQSEKCAKLIINHQTFYIVEEKQCFFVVEAASSSVFTSKISGGSSNTRKFKDSSVISKINSMDSLLSTKFAHNNKNQSVEMDEQDEKKLHYLIPEPIQAKKKEENGYDQTKRKNSFNILDCIKQIELSLDNDIKTSYDQIKGGNQKEEENDDYIESLRASLEKNKSWNLKKFEDVKWNNPKSNVVHHQDEESETETICKQKVKIIQKDELDDIKNFVRQSLQAKSPLKKNETFGQKKSTTPRFLASKKNQEAPKTTPSKIKNQEAKFFTKKNFQLCLNNQLKPLARIYSTTRVSPVNSPRTMEPKVPVYSPKSPATMLRGRMD